MSILEEANKVAESIKHSLKMFGTRLITEESKDLYERFMTREHLYTKEEIDSMMGNIKKFLQAIGENQEKLSIFEIVELSKRSERSVVISYISAVLFGFTKSSLDVEQTIHNLYYTMMANNMTGSAISEIESYVTSKIIYETLKVGTNPDYNIEELQEAAQKCDEFIRPVVENILQIVQILIKFRYRVEPQEMDKKLLHEVVDIAIQNKNWVVPLDIIKKLADKKMFSACYQSLLKRNKQKESANNGPNA